MRKLLKLGSQVRLTSRNQVGILILNLLDENYLMSCPTGVSEVV